MFSLAPDPLELLSRMKDRHKRGHKFEHLLAELLSEANYRVTTNPAIAKPRQTDIFAAKDATEYLVEAKWQEPPFDLDDLDSHRARMGRTPQHVIGVVFSMSGFSETVVREVASRRERVILLVDGEEVKGLFRGNISPDTLLRDKRDALVQDAKIPFWNGASRWSHISPPEPRLLPRPDLALRSLDGKSLPWVSGRGTFDRIVFAQALTDVDWVPALGHGVGFHLGLVLEYDTDAVAHILNALKDIGWLSQNGTYSIQQAETSWHGVGAKGFLSALGAYKRRYRLQTGHLHHSEAATYYDASRHGMFTLAVDMSSRGDCFRRIALSALLYGIPVDTDPLKRLAITCGQSDNVYFRPLSGPGPVITVPFRGEIKVEPCGFLCTDRKWVGGLVVRNPFYHTTTFAQYVEGGDVAGLGDSIRALREQEILVCRLSSWHPLGDEDVHYYHLRRLEVVRTYDAAVWGVQCDWRGPTSQVDDALTSMFFGEFGEVVGQRDDG